MNMLSVWKKSFEVCSLGLCLALIQFGWVYGDPQDGADASNHWEQCGWGGGGFFYSAAYSTTEDGVIYMGGDVCGIAKSEDDGMNWRMINNGLADYGVFSLAVDPSNGQIVYAATERGICKSVNGGQKWELLPHTGSKENHITGEKGKSIRCIAIDPTDGNVIYAATPVGKIWKSVDGGQNWELSYTKASTDMDPGLLRVQYGKVGFDFFGDIWMPIALPTGTRPESCSGIAFEFKGDGSTPKDCYLTLKTKTGPSYRSKNINYLFQGRDVTIVALKTTDFVLDPDYATRNPDKVATVPAAPDWSDVNRFDLSCSGNLPETASVAKLGKMYFVIDGTNTQIADLANGTGLQKLGNILIGAPQGAPIYSVCVSAKNHEWVLAASQEEGALFSQDSGKTWTALKTPAKATSAVFAPSDPTIMYGTFGAEGIWKSVDQGETWNQMGEVDKAYSATEVQVSPEHSSNVYVIGNQNFWNGVFKVSNDGGKSWITIDKMAIDKSADPTLQNKSLSGLSNLTINPLHTQKIFISANWRPVLSEDGGMTWTEHDRRADISCITDIRFSGNRTYASVMDEGTLASDDDGETWSQLWPLTPDSKTSGHNWRVGVTNVSGEDHVIGTGSPWGDDINLVMVSENGGKTYKEVRQGLPTYRPQANTMWGQGYARALSIDPKDPKTVYLGIDGDPSGGKSGGGIFKSDDGGYTWIQLPNQPASRRMFFGLMVDPTDSNRIYWATCGEKGGLYASADAGNSWKKVFSQENWLFNVLVTADGTVYAPGHNLWRSTDHGRTWKNLSNFPGEGSIVGLEINPKDPKTIWVSQMTWDESNVGGVYKTNDGGETWKEITGDIPFVKPMVLRYNPETQELWAGGVGLYKIKQ